MKPRILATPTGDILGTISTSTSAAGSSPSDAATKAVIPPSEAPTKATGRDPCAATAIRSRARVSIP